MEKNIKIPPSILSELKKVGFSSNDWNIYMIREKFGIFVFRLVKENKSFVGKYFNEEQAHGKREIQYYEILKIINVPTLNMIAKTDCILILEDIESSNIYRLGTKNDMSDEKAASCIGKWFKKLHTSGEKYIGLSNLHYLDNFDNEFSEKRIKNAINKSNSYENPLWDLFLNNLEYIKKIYLNLCNTITYNDFWWDNLAIAKDLSSAIMFDYNCMYRKYAYADIRHILSVMDKNAGTAFMDAYGIFNNYEKIFDDVYRPLSGLIEALNSNEIPSWGKEFINMLGNSELVRRLNSFQKYFR